MKVKITKETDLGWAVILICGWLILPAFSVRGQEELKSTALKLPGEAPSIRFEQVGLEDGLQQGSVSEIMQDRQGYIWMTTQDGLHRYDGYDFKVYSFIPFDTTSLNGMVTHVEEAADGDLWLTNGEGLQRMDRDTDTFSSYLHDPEDSTSLSSNFTGDVRESRRGDLWVGTYGAGINQMPEGKNGVFRRYRHDPLDPNSLSSDIINYIMEDAEGRIWASSPRGINRIDPETGAVKRFLYDPERPQVFYDQFNIMDLYFPPGDPGSVWLATGRGLLRMDTETGEHESFILEKEDPLHRLNYLEKVIADPSLPGILWVSGPGTGIARFDTSTGEFTSYRHDPGDPHSLGNDGILSLFADRSGTIWAGHNGTGLNVFNPGAVNFSHLRHDPEDAESLGPGLIDGIFMDSMDNLWVGSTFASEGGYLTQFDTRTGEIIRHQHDPNDPASLLRGSYTSFAENGSGQFYVGSSRGLMLLDRKTGKVRDLAHQPKEDNLYRNWIMALLLEGPDKRHLLVGSGAGVDRLDTETGAFTAIKLRQDSTEVEPNVISFLRSRDSTLWIGTMQGLFRIDKEGSSSLASAYNARDTTTISNNFIAGIYEREREPGILWLATSGGLNRYDTETGIATHYTQKDGLPNNVIYGILEDRNGSLWMSTNRGISNFDPEKKSFRNYGLDDGLMALEYDQFAYAKGNDEMMYFGSLLGVTGFIPEKLSINETPPQVALSGFKLFNKEVTPGPGSLLQQPLSETREITLKYKQNEITFDFVALHFVNSGKNTYTYMLEGFDSDWVDAGTKRSASYTNLPPGTYNFRVRAANSDGIWSEEEASVQLSVLPPWYRTWWAYLLFVLLLACIIFAVDRFQRKRLRKQEKERTALKEAELRVEAENQRRADTEQLSKIGRAITSSLSITRIIDIVYEHVNELMDAAIFGIGIYNPKKQRLEFPATKENGKMLRPYTHGLDEENRLAVWCFNNSKEIIIGDMQKESGQYINSYLPPVKGQDPTSLIYLPLVHQDKTIGVITTQSFKRNAFTPYHVHLLKNLATYAAIALDNASAYRKLDATLSDLKLTQEQLIQQEKLASLGQLTAGIAHEIKNPLNFVNNFSELSVELIEETREELKTLRSNSSTGNGELTTMTKLLEEIESNLKKIHKHGSRADGIVRSMLQHSRSGSGSMEPVDLNELIREYVNLAFHGMRAGRNPIEVEIDLQLDEQAGKIPMIQEDFSRVIINLCNNAFEAMREKMLLPSNNGGYRPQLSVRTIRKNTKVHIEIKDNGPGIPEKYKDKILQPFFTTKKGTEGTGLGLSISNDIVKVHGGTLSIESVMGQGTCFSIKLPQNQQVEMGGLVS